MGETFMAKDIQIEEILREYLLRCISKDNKVLSGMISSAYKSNRRAFALAFDDIYEAFVDKKNIEWKKIKEDKENIHPSYKPYQYFDVDTLYTYKLFLDKVIKCVDERADSSVRKLVNAKELSDGLKDATFWLNDPKVPAEEKGYYDKFNPIKPYFKKGRLSPKKALTGDMFREKYGEYDCVAMLNDYIGQKHSKLKSTRVDSESELSETINYRYDGEVLTLTIIDKQYYVSRKGEGLTAIEAISNEGRLYGTYLQNGDVYCGDVFDIDGNLIELNGGGEHFYPVKSKEAQLREEQEKLEKKYANLNDGDQISLL